MVLLSAAGCVHTVQTQSILPLVPNKERLVPACLATPLKNSPPAPSPLRIIATKAEKLLLSPHLLLFCLLTCVGGGGDAFSPAGGGPDGEGGGRWGRNFFWEKLHSRGLRQEQRENYRFTESQSQYEKRSFLP